MSIYAAAQEPIYPKMGLLEIRASDAGSSRSSPDEQWLANPISSGGKQVGWHASLVAARNMGKPCP